MPSSKLTLRSPLSLLIIAAVLGSTLGLMESTGSATDTNISLNVPIQYAAEINNVPILYRDYQRALSLFAEGKRGKLSTKDRELVLERLIQEELLVQQAVSADLVRSDPRLRGAVLQSMLAGLDIESRSKLATGEANDGLEAYLKQLRRSASIQREPLQ